jgi:hypothetical protein
MLAKAETNSVATTVDRWLAQFERALAERDDVLLETLFHADSHWRDVLALTWGIRTVSGLDAIVKELRAHVGRARPAGFRTAPQRTAPRHVTRAGTSAIEAIFQFETADGRGSGVLRLTPDENHGTALKARTLLTSLDELSGATDHAGRSRSYSEGPPLDDCDLITTSIPLSLARKSHILLTEQARNMDRPLLDALERMGFKLDFGDDGTGWQFKYLTRGGGYYFNVGCSDLIVEGEIGLVQFSDIAGFVSEGASMRTGDTLAADLIVLATGYKGLEHQVSGLFGDDVAARVGPIWGFGDDQELRNMFVRTGQPGLWSSQAVSPSAASTPSIWVCRSRPVRPACCPGSARFRTPRARVARFEPKRNRTRIKMPPMSVGVGCREGG